MLLLTSLVLGFATLDAFSGFVGEWLHLTPMRPCLDVTIWDASPWCRLLRAYLSTFSLHAMLCLPCLFMPSIGFYASLHACLHVHAWVLLANVSSMLQHNEIMEIWSKPTFVPRRHHLLFAFLFVCLLSCFFACHVYHAYLLYASFTCPMQIFLFIACLLVSCSCLCMNTHGARTHGAKACSPKRKHKGRGTKHVDINQATMFSCCRGLAFPIWLCTLLNPFPSSFLS